MDLVALECCESDENETKNEQYNFPFVQAKNGEFVRTLTHAQLLIWNADLPRLFALSRLVQWSLASQVLHENTNCCIYSTTYFNHFLVCGWRTPQKVVPMHKPFLHCDNYCSASKKRLRAFHGYFKFSPVFCSPFSFFIFESYFFASNFESSTHRTCASSTYKSSHTDIPCRAWAADLLCFWQV